MPRGTSGSMYYPYLHLAAANIIIIYARQVELVSILGSPTGHVIKLACNVIPVGSIIVINPELLPMGRITLVVAI